MNIFRTTIEEGRYLVQCEMENNQVKTCKVFPIVDDIVFSPFSWNDAQLEPIVNQINKIFQ
jgi:hypothetical protein